MNRANRFVEAVTTLIQQTQDGLLQWEASAPPDELAQQVDTVVDTIFVARKDGWVIRVYPYKRKVWLEEDIWHWDERVALEVSDEKKASWWRFPDEGAIWDLLDAVKFKVSGVDQFIQKLLAK